MPAMRPRASWMSASVGPVSVVLNLEHPLQYLPHGGERVELAALDLVEEPPELGIVGHRLLQVRLRPCRGDREDLAREVPPPALVEQPVGLEVSAVLGDLLPELLDP